jgi:hypothetical protein
MSARELRGQKRLWSNADEVTTKRSKTNASEEEGSEVEQQQVAKKGKGKKGKKAR